MKNDIINENYKLIKTISPQLDEKSIIKRIKNIKWSLKNFPQTTEITVNSLCNNKCIFCYNPPELLKNDIHPSLKSIYKTLYHSKKNGAWICVIIGGEPTLRKDIGKIASFARKIGYTCVKLCTNGRKLSDRKFLRSLIDDGFNMFDISIHSHIPEVHDKLVGISKAFSATMKACENVISMGFELGTNQVINNLNYRSFAGFMDFAYNQLGINYYNIIYGHYSGCMYEHKDVLKVKVSSVISYIKEGMEVLVKSKMPSFARILVNFPPCLLTEYLNILADWEKTGKPEVLYVGEELINMKEMKKNQGRYSPLCKKCILYYKCRGFDSTYFPVFGDKELKPVKEIPEFKLKTLFDI